jgi:proton-dependent oligopeptide transporter, POT family
MRPHPSSKDILGHPRGLATLAATELWERISFHGMVALLTLYMADQLLLPGHIEKIVNHALDQLPRSCSTRTWDGGRPHQP